ncbi:hypothetical protein LJR030_003153 [Rhizobium sp. LjRoot30]|uniref:hypothetical protein n=1 Tax=Rhizobium sp. LjRoot30 TaxID=3342320 RepID=UPI003ECEC54C
MSSENFKTYLNSEHLDLIEGILNRAGFEEISPEYSSYAAFLVGRFERGTTSRAELAYSLQRHHGAIQTELSRRLPTRFHRYAIQGLPDAA